MSAATKAPPRKSGNATSNRRSAATPVQQDTRTVNDRRTEGLIGLAQLGQGIALMFGQYADAATIGQHFPPVAKELSNVADTSDTVAGPIDLIIEVGPYGALIAAILPLGMQIAANHGWLDANRLFGQGVVPPAVLEAQMKAQMARMQSEAMKAQNIAMQEAAAAQKEYEALMATQNRPPAE